MGFGRAQETITRSVMSTVITVLTRMTMPRDRDEDAFEDDDRPRRRKRYDDYDDDEDDDDDRPRRKRSSGAGGLDAIIPFRNGLALGAYYCGVFGLISCFIFGVGGLFGIIPIVLGILGLMKASKDPEAHGRVHAWVGIGLGAIELLTGCGTVGFFGYVSIREANR
jgi:hypothetical protein